MKKQMKRTVYEAPVTERFQVELEGTFCASVVKDQSSTTETTGHEMGAEIDADDKGWNDDNKNPWG